MQESIPSGAVNSLRRSINALVARNELAWDLTMGLLALVFIAAGIIDEHPLGWLNQDIAVPVELGLTVIFALEFAVRIFAADSRARYLRSHWIDLLALLPAIRFLRVLRLGRAVYVLRAARLLRLAVFVRLLAQADRVANQVDWIARRNGVHLALLAAVGLVVLGGSTVWELEHSTNRFFANFGDAIWWAFATVATVGYGDGPATLLGRVVAVVLMVVGISCFGLITATVTSLFIHRSKTEGAADGDILAVLKDIQERLDRLETRQMGTGA